MNFAQEVNKMKNQIMNMKINLEGDRDSTKGWNSTKLFVCHILFISHLFLSSNFFKIFLFIYLLNKEKKITRK